MRRKGKGRIKWVKLYLNEFLPMRNLGNESRRFKRMIYAEMGCDEFLV